LKERRYDFKYEFMPELKPEFNGRQMVKGKVLNRRLTRGLPMPGLEICDFFEKSQI
jgi:hypothetical protein